MKRFFHHVFAVAFGYLWMPCISCKQHFGGHEVARLLRRGNISFVRVGEEQFGFLVCPGCFEAHPDASPLPPDHTAFFALHSGVVAQYEGTLVGLPSVPMKDVLFWGNMRLLAGAMFLLFIIPAVILQCINSWLSIGLGMGFLLQLICNRVSPPLTRYPAVAVLFQGINFAFLVYHGLLAWWHR